MQNRLNWKGLLVMGIISFSQISMAMPVNPVLAKEQTNTSSVSMIESLKLEIQQTESYKEQDTSLLGEAVKTADGIEEEIQDEKEKQQQEAEYKSSIGIVEDTNSVNSEPIAVCPNPGTSATKTYMDAAKVTNTASNQYKLLQTMHINDQGIYATDDGYLGVALGSYFGPIGSKYLVTLENGVTLKVIKADEKADIHVYNGCYHREDGSVMEFIIDTETAGNYFGTVGGYVLGGNFNNYEGFRGQIVAMEKVLS